MSSRGRAGGMHLNSHIFECTTVVGADTKLEETGGARCLSHALWSEYAANFRPWPSEPQPTLQAGQPKWIQF
eukprot:840667-Rhodomonas_salina.1